MLFSQSLQLSLWAAALLAGVGASPVDQKHKFHRRQQAPFPITGISGGVQPRMEMRDLQQNAPDQWNIYLLALSNMQNVDQSDYLSYFQLSGIHGRPMADWDGVSGNTNPQGSGWCTHVSNIFLSWHRPYLALYEQIVISHAIDAANQFQGGDQQRYLAAAQALRIPYWDWAMNPDSGQNAIPDSMTSPGISVNTPQGQMMIYNPLYKYEFHPVDPGLYYSEFLQYPSTFRHPTTVDASAQDQDDQLIGAINNIQPQLAARLYNLFTNYNNYTIASNEGWDNGGAGTYDSFEAVHDQIHVTVGGNNGDMSVIDVSAFDPAFWLHHAMIDRVAALWQGLYPDSYVEANSQAHGNYWYNQGDVLDAGTPLKPFFADSNGNFHTSNSVRDPTALGYTYSELMSGNPDDIRQSVNRLYGGTSAPASKRSLYTGGNFTSSPLSIIQPRQYLVNIRTDKYTQYGSYSIHIFLGEPSDNPTCWSTDPNLVGTHAVFSSPSADTGHTVIVSGTMPLTHVLKEYHLDDRLASLAEPAIVEFLTKNLQWKLTKCDGTEIEPSSIPDLQISVVSSEVQPADSITDFPELVGGWKIHPGVTEGKPNGICNEDDISQ